MKFKKLSVLVLGMMFSFGTQSVYVNAEEVEKIVMNKNKVEIGEPLLIVVETDEELEEGEFLSLSFKNLSSNQLLYNYMTLDKVDNYNYGGLSTKKLEEGRYSILKIEVVDKNDDIIRLMDSNNITLGRYEFDVIDEKYNVNHIEYYDILDSKAKTGESIAINAYLEEDESSKEYSATMTFEHITKNESFDVELDKTTSGKLLSTSEDYVIPPVEEGVYDFKELTLYKEYEYGGLELSVATSEYDSEDLDTAQITIEKGKEKVEVDSIYVNNSSVYKYNDINKNEDLFTLKPNFINDNATVTIPYSFFADIYRLNPNFIFKVQTNEFTYNLPVDIQNRTERINTLLNRAKTSDLDIEDTVLKVTITDYSDNDDYKEAFINAFKEALLVSNIYGVKLQLINGDKILGEVNNFIEPTTKTINFNDRTGVEGVFILESDLDTKFVPNKIEGSTATINSIDNGVFAVVLNKGNFSDVPVDAWYTKSVTLSTNKGLTSGTGDGKFAPMGLISRAEFVTMIVNGLDLPENQNSVTEYTDVLPSSWYYDSIMLAKRYGLLEEITTTNSFNPTTFITREEMANIIGKVIQQQEIAMNMMYIDLESIFTDSELININYVNEVQDVYKIGIMKGNEKGEFNPKGNATRAEAVKVQINLLELLGKL